MVLALLVACAPVEPQAMQPAAAPDEASEEVSEDVLERTEDTGKEPAPVNDEIVALSDKADSVKGYSFVLARLPERSGERTYFVRDGKAKVKPARHIDMDGWSADYVFLDYEAETAVAYCLELASCRDEQLKQPVSFADWVVPLPEYWLPAAERGTLTGRQQFNSRQVIVVGWEADGQYYEAYLDSFYGLPQRVAIAADDEFADIVGGYEYQGFQTNAVSGEEVTPPY